MNDRSARVLVGVDGTEGSIEALRWAAHEAARRQWHLQVMTCAELPVAVEAGMVGTGGSTGRTMDSLVAEQEEINQRVIALVRTFGLGLIVGGETVLGAPAYAILSAAQPGDTIVVGATSHPGRLTDMLGSVATVIAHRAKGSTVVIVHGTVGRDTSLRCVVVGVDDSPGSDAALAWAAEEATLAGAELVLVHAWSYPYSSSRTSAHDARAEMRLDAMRALETSANQVSDTHPDLVCNSIVSEESPAKAIIDAGAGADLIVVGSRGRGGFASMLLGSVSRTVLQHAGRPVAVIREALQ